MQENPDFPFILLRNGVFCESGKGDIDFRAVTTELEQQGYDGWMVLEQDVIPGMDSPKESASRNREFLANIGF